MSEIVCFSDDRWYFLYSLSLTLMDDCILAMINNNLSLVDINENSVVRTFTVNAIKKPLILAFAQM